MMKSCSLLLSAVVMLAASVILVDAAQSRPAKCFNSSEGNYRCNFNSFGGNGSFTISAPGYQTITLEIIRRGVSAEGFIELGSGRYRALSGTYGRSRKDRACWINRASEITQVCAWGL